MKIRNGFVSNSSSSSFMMFMPKNTKTINDMEGFKLFLLDEWGMEDENIESYMDTHKNTIQEQFGNGNGFIMTDVEYGCEGTIKSLAADFGGTIIDLD